MALRASGLPAAGQGKSKVLTVTERLSEYRRKRGEKKEQRIKRKVSVSFLLFLLPTFKMPSYN